jgi:hypothetical protein
VSDTPEQPFAGPGAPSGESLTSPERSDEEERAAARQANRFDVRRIIGGLFVVYGVILTVIGIVGSTAIKHKAAGVNINLWAGLGMLVFGALMIFWALSRPVMPEPPETRGQGSGRLRRAPA